MFIELVLVRVSDLSSLSMLSLVLIKVTVPAQAREVVHVQSDARIADVVRRQMLDVMDLARWSSALGAQVRVTHEHGCSDLFPFFAIVE